MYAATTGTFLQRDPLGQPGQPIIGYSHEAVTRILRSSQSNLYAYVGNNPLSFVDPYGLEKQVLCADGSVRTVPDNTDPALASGGRGETVAHKSSLTAATIGAISATNSCASVNKTEGSVLYCVREAAQRESSQLQVLAYGYCSRSRWEWHRDQNRCWRQVAWKSNAEAQRFPACAIDNGGIGIWYRQGNAMFTSYPGSNCIMYQ